MNDELVYIEGHLKGRDRARLVRLLRRAEDIGDFEPAALDDTIPPWIVVVGWGKWKNSTAEESPEEDSLVEDNPVSVSRLTSGLVFSGPNVDVVIHKIKRWLARKGSVWSKM